MKLRNSENMEINLQKAEIENSKNLIRLRSLRPLDDDFMRCMFKDNIPLAQLVLRIITSMDDLVITGIETQRDMKRLVGARSICLDAYGNDSQGRKYDLEIQRADSGAAVRRARYHASAMDVENLSAGQDFDELPEAYTIFITEHDVFAEGKSVYKIERINLGTGKPFNDGEHIIYANSKFRDDSEFGKLMHDFNCSDPNKMKIGLMRETARYYKENPEGVSVMCKIMEDMVNESAREKAIAIAKKLILRGTNTLEEIAEDTELSLQTVKELAGVTT